MKPIFLLGIIFLLGCNRQNQQRTQRIRLDDSFSSAPKADTVLVSKHLNKVIPEFHQSLQLSKSYLQGTWAKNPDQNVLFTIKNDSIFYFEDPNPVLYEIHNDTFYIHLSKNYVVKNKLILINNDSLVMIDNEEILRLYKRSSKYLKY